MRISDKAVGWMAVVAWLSACGGSDAPGTTTDAQPDTVADAADTTAPGDTSADAPDAPEDGEDAMPGDTAPGDTAQPTTFAAVPGARCTPATRIGLVSVYESAWGTPGAIEASAVIDDRADPRIPSEPKLKDASCGFFQHTQPSACPPCPTNAVCAPDGTCQPMPKPAADLTLVVSAGGKTQTFVGDGTSSGAWGQVTLPGRTFAVEVKWEGKTLTLGDTAVPQALADLAGQLPGGYDKPTSLALTWTPPADAATLFTRIPINHHAGGPTFTECAVDASTGALTVPGPMLTPLAVSTGLEFQGVEHVRFAAAQTPAGCVEVRFQAFQYLSLQ